jgi:branched-chain amino acid aminotransferase
MTVWMNGRLVDPGQPVITADDHGLTVGDGVFETAKVVDGRPFALTRHLRRLDASARGLFLDVDLDYVRRGVAEVLDAGPVALGRLRITVTGGPSPLGSDRGSGPLTYLIAVAPATVPVEPAAVVTVPWVRNDRSAVAGLKTTSYAENVVALARAHSVGAAEAIFGNTRGNLCEGTGTNVFLEFEGHLVTPPLSAGCLAGVTRELLVEWLPDLVEERDVPLSAISDTQEAFLTSSLRDVHPIATVDAIPLPKAPGPLTRRALEVFKSRAAADTDP